MDPQVSLDPPSTAVGQPSVPVTIVASDHYSDNDFNSFRIILDGDTVTGDWTVVVTEGGWGTGRMKTFTARGTVTLSEADPERTLEVRLCDTQFCTTPASTFTLRRPGVEVGEDGTSHVEPPAAPHSKPFTVRNTGLASATFALTAECRDVQGQRVTPCSVSQASITLAAGATGSVTASYPGTQQGSLVTVVVRARQTDAPGVEDAGWTDVEIRAPEGLTEAAPQVTLVPLTAGAVVERSQCVTVATAVRGAYECGDLRVAHALPAHRTRGRTWAPVLLYNSQHAHPRPTVYADVTVPAGSPPPTSVEAVVTMGDGAVHRASFAGYLFLPGQARRIGVQWDALGTGTGLYPYQLQVISHYPGGPRATGSLPGEIAIVNRSWTGFGAGWWPAGVERLQCIDCGTGGARTLWIGGDGSTRVYERITPGGWTAWGSWVAQNPDGGPDTLVLGAQGFVRKIPGGGRVYFDLSGLHTSTVNRLGQTTRIVHGTYGPTEIYVPGSGPGGPGTGDPAWIFSWDNAAALVRSVSTTALGAPTRTTTLTIDGNRRVTAITDPDSGSVAFAYSETATPRRMMGQRDRRGTWAWYGYDNAGKLTIRTTYLGDIPDPAVDVTTRFLAAESQGVAFENATGAASVSAAQAYTSIDGPRTDVRDYTWIWHSHRGAVHRVRDALGAETFVQFDARFPALATLSMTSTGQATRAHYDARGRVDTAIVVNPLGDGRDQATVYTYDNRWDAPTTIRSYEVSAGGTWTALAGTAHAAYDTLTGNVLWRRQGEDTRAQVNFRYYTSGSAAGQLASVRAPSGVPGQTARDSLLYDGRGNLRMTISPLGFLTLNYRDAFGRDTLSITPTTPAGATTESGLLASGVRQRTLWDTMDRVRRTWTIGPAMAHDDATGGVVPWTTGADTLHVVTEPDGEGLPLQVLRWAAPDTANVHVLTTDYTYDRAGRKLTETDGFVTHRYAYDPAGNVRTWTTPRGHQVTSDYDALGRMTRRTVPAASYARACPSATSPCEHPYPYYPNGPNGSLVIPEERTTFRFDSAGNMVYAENADAIVRRSYYPGGALRTDSLAIRSVEGVDFGAHRYGLAYTYNVDGRVTSLQHPQTLAGPEVLDRYTYNPVTAALDSLIDRRGHRFAFHRNFAQQLTSLRGPAYTDSSRYDLEGRLLERRETASLAGVLHHDSLFYDARAKLMRVNVGATNGRGASTYRQWYSGGGNLIATDWRNEMDLGRVQEAYAMDAMGNVAWRRAGDGSSSTGGDSIFRNVYDFGRGRLAEIDKLNLGVPNQDFRPNETTREYDPSATWTGRCSWRWGTSATRPTASRGTSGPAPTTAPTSVCATFTSVTCGGARRE